MADTRKTLAAKGPAGKAPAEAMRHPFGPRAVGAILPGVTRPAFRRRSPAAARILADWEAIMGPVLAATAAPRRLSAGTLTLDCAGPAALELQHLAPLLIERINTAIGARLVERLRLVQGMPPAPLPLPVRRPAAPADVVVPDLPPGPVGEALAALARHIPARR